MHSTEWANSTLGTQALLQNSTLSDSDLNSKLIKNLDKQNKTANYTSLKCLVGDEKCMYKNRQNLIDGKMTDFALTQLKEDPQLELPESNDFVVLSQGQETKELIDSSGQLDVTNLLNSKLE